MLRNCLKISTEGTSKMNTKIDKSVELFRRREMSEVEKKILKGIIQENMSDGNEGFSSDDDDGIPTRTVNSRNSNKVLETEDGLKSDTRRSDPKKKHKRGNAFGNISIPTVMNFCTKFCIFEVFQTLNMGLLINTQCR